MKVIKREALLELESTHQPLSKHLQLIIDVSKEHSQISLEYLLQQLGKRGYTSLIFFISLAFSFPISIPGLSTPFGLVLAFLGLWIALGKELGLPSWLKSKSLSFQSFERIGKKAIWLFSLLERFMRPRILSLSENKLFISLNGLIVLVLAILLALPIPIPLTNILAAFPIVLISLGQLEKDGVLIIMGYAGAIFSITLFGILFTTLSTLLSFI
ncbi:MAG: exopolysaccharide biosynthesis protein [Chlamydiales bacterium]|nr:exopolysaccharide biosynthesis protein [Chlamydiales bacterium]